MARPSLRWLAVLAVAVLVAAGCGGDDDDGGGGDALTRAEFLEQGNAICSAGNDRLDAMFEEVFPTEDDLSDPDKQAEAKDRLVEDVQSQIDDIGDLEPPEDMADDVEAFLDDAQAALDEVEDQSPEEFVSQEEDPFADVNATADEIGLTECADDGEEGE